MPTLTQEVKNEIARQARIELAKQDLSSYIRQAWQIIEPATAYMHNWHIDAMSEHLTAVTQGQIRRLLINIPPRYMKSIMVSVMWPTWTWISHPSRRWLFASYAHSLSVKHSVDRRMIIQSDWYRSRWGDVYHLTSDQNVKTEYLNSQRGVMVATSVGAGALGKGGDVIIVDDPHNPREAQSDVQRKAAIDFFDLTLSTRLDDKKTGAIVVIMQRLHERDLSGHILERGDYGHLYLPAEAETRTIIQMPISFKEIIREEGDILWPEREGAKEIAEQKRALGSYGYSGQYQQRPSPAEGGLLKREWWRYYKQAPARFDEIIQSWDMTFKETIGGSYVVGQVWGRVGADKYLLDQVRDRMDFLDTLRAVRAVAAKWPQAKAKLVEDKANGPAVINALRREISGLIAVSPQGSKEARAAVVSPEIEAGNVHLPDPSIAPWVHDFVEECATFPKGVYDDQVDCFSQALIRLAVAKALPEETRILFREASLYA
ncbi:MAG: hypothetical protein DDT29_00379 [Dehalococcoidia bacterium]|nr:hypothetical protein [Bacillota bacterium]